MAFNTDIQSILSTIKQPINIPLFAHQLESVKKMEKLEIDKYVIENEGWIKETSLGVNSDICGSGKSLAMVGLISRDRMEWDLDTPYISEVVNSTCKNLIKYRKVNRYTKLPTTLILAHDILLNHWGTECSKSDLNYTILKSDKNFLNLYAENYDIVIVSPNMYNKLISAYHNYAWKRFIFDQPCCMSVPNMKGIVAGFNWFLTPYYDKILIKHKTLPKANFIRNIIDTDNRDVFKGIIVKSKLSTLPDKQHINYNSIQYTDNTKITLTSPAIPNLLQNDQIDLIIMHLGCKIKQVEITNTQCGICLDTIINPIVEPICGKTFCTKCLFTWLVKKATCPMCRNAIITSNLIYSMDTELFKPYKHEPFLNCVLNTVSKSDKCLIFSSDDSLYKTIGKHLNEHNIISKEIKGNYKIKNNCIDMYTSGQLSVIMINAIFLPIGINLQETTDLIICGDVNQHIKNQLINKICRFGSSKNKYLNVHLLTTVY